MVIRYCIRKNSLFLRQYLLLTVLFSAMAFASGEPDHSAAFAASPAVARDPNAVLDELLKGNSRFIAGTAVHPDCDLARRIETAKSGQKPVATVLTCADSRVPVELIFDAGIGTLFVVRVAGNVAEKSQVGSLEYGAEHLGIPLIIVMGHTRCGAVTAAVEGGEASVPVRSILNNIEPAVAKVKKVFGGAADDDLVAKAIVENIWQTIDDIFKTSPAIRSLVKAGRLKVAGALYDIGTGKVEPLGVHHRQDVLIRMYDGKKSGMAGTKKK